MCVCVCAPTDVRVSYPQWYIFGWLYPCQVRVGQAWLGIPIVEIDSGACLESSECQ